jgi:hypothetical protein
VGYEVIDEHGPVSGADRSATSSSRTPAPYEFGDLEPAAPPPRDDTTRRPQLQRLLQLPAILASFTLVAGAVVGGYVVHQHAAGQAAAEQRGVVQAIAEAENQLANGMNGVRMATLTVRLTNFGPKPIQPVLSEDGQTPSQVTPLVQASSPHPEAPANGGDALVTLTVPLACDQELGDLLLPVRTLDRQVHQIPVRAPNSEILQQDRTMCNDGQADTQYVSVTLVGSVDKPVLQFTNMSQQARRMWLRTENNELHPLSGVRITLGHPFPMDIDPQDTIRVPLQVDANRCIKDVSLLESAQVWLAFQESAVGRNRLDSDWQNVSGAAVGSAVTAAILRTCATS